MDRSTILAPASVAQRKAPPTPPTVAPVAVALPDSLLRPFAGRLVRLRLVSGDEIAGTLSEVGKFELRVTTTEGAIVVFKAGVLWITGTSARP